MYKIPFSTPILFLVFNRPEKTQRVFEAIRKVQPKQLFVAADGPRRNVHSDINNCLEVRKMVEQVDWDCEVKTLFRDQNLGCRVACSSAITWFFENEPEGIILEDDCLPDPSFFLFCETMLERYRHDTRVMHIGGDNFQLGIKRGTGDYYFSKIAHIWGWASWRRAWVLYDREMVHLESFYEQKVLQDIFWDKTVQGHLKRTLQRVKNGIDTWDYQWTYTCLINNGLCVTPQNNLVVNIGFDNMATHGANAPIDLHKVKLGKLDTFNPPLTFVPIQQADNYAFRTAADITLLRRIYNRLRRDLKFIFK